MEQRVEVRDEHYKGIVCILILEDDGSVFIEIKESGKREKKKVKLNNYLNSFSFSEKHPKSA